MSRTHGLRGVNAPPFDGLADIRKFVIVRDDFIGGDTGTAITTGTIGELGWQLDIIAGDGASNADTLTGVASGHPGVVRFGSGSTTITAADEIAATIGGDNILLEATDPVYFGVVASQPVLAETNSYFGLFADAETVAGLGVNSVCFEYDASTGGTWLATTRAASTSTVVDTGVTVVADQFDTLEFAATTASVEFYVNGEHVASSSTNIPTAALGVGIKIATEGTTEAFVDVDAFMLRLPVSRGGDAVVS